MALNLGIAFPAFEEFGTLPNDINLEQILDPKWLESRAVTVYDRNPNLVCEIPARDGSVIVKWFGWRSRFHYRISPVIQSRAQVSWNIANKILASGGRTPNPLYTCTRRNHGFIRENIFVTENVAGQVSLRNWLKRDPDEKELEATLSDLARNLATMHNGGVFHRDLTAGNILVDDQRHTFLIDLNRGELRRPTKIRRLGDLAKIYFGELDRSDTREIVQFFFREYGRCSSPDFDWETGYIKARIRLEQKRRNKKRLRQLLGNRK